MHVRDVEIFRAVMQSGAASRAADLLGISQPAVSQALRRLEAEAGLALFVRARARLQPTPEARAFLVEVERSFVGIASLQHRLLSLRQFGLDRLSIAAYPALGLGLVPRVLATMQADRPALNVSLQVMSSRDVRERVLAGLCEIGLMADEASTLGLNHYVLSEVQGVIAIKKGHRLTREKHITVTQFLSQPIVSLNAEDASTRRLITALGSEAHRYQPRIETPYGVSVCECVAQGLGIGLVNPLVGASYVDRGIVLRPFALRVPFRSILATTAARPLSTTAKQFITVLRQTIADVSGQQK
jgi:DNA-binding transcriptional LysR family regulator